MNLPQKKYMTYRILVEMLNGSGTMWQICERMGIPAQSNRDAFDSLQTAGHIYATGITFHMAHATRVALVPPTPYVGQVTGPRYRGPNQAMPVTIYRREVHA